MNMKVYLTLSDLRYKPSKAKQCFLLHRFCPLAVGESNTAGGNTTVAGWVQFI